MLASVDLGTLKARGDLQAIRAARQSALRVIGKRRQASLGPVNAISRLSAETVRSVMMSSAKMPRRIHGRKSPEFNMTDNNELAGIPEHVPESLRALAIYLERSLDKATSIVMIRHTADACTVYLGDPEGSQEDLKQIGTITIPVASGFLESTSSGANTVQIDGQFYRFVRSFTRIRDMAAIVFSTK